MIVRRFEDEAGVKFDMYEGRRFANDRTVMITVNTVNDYNTFIVLKV